MRAKKKYGQHFLQPEWAEKLVAAIDPRAADRFLEIGPGPGALTFRLAARVAHLTAVEIDSEMVRLLHAQTPPNVTVLQADFLDFDMASLVKEQRPIRVAGNLPYNVSSPILFRLLAIHRMHGGIEDATLMLQAEVAERIGARSGTKDYGVLSILTQLHADVRIALRLPQGAFRPPPKVQSTVLRLTFRPAAVTLGDEALFERMVRSMFMQRRKTLGNALRPFATTVGRDAAGSLRAAGLDPSRRAETLQLDELARLADVFASAER